MNGQSALRIGDLAASSGLSVDAVRYYERMGLIKPAGRTEGGFRTYRRDATDRIAFIRQAQRLGLRLREIAELLGTPGFDGKRHCQKVRAVLLKRLEDVEKQMVEIRSFRRTLKAALENCDRALEGDGVDECPVVQSLTLRRPVHREARP